MLVATPVYHQDSSLLANLAAAQALVVRAPFAPAAEPRKKLPPLHLHAPQLRALAERKTKAKGFFESGMAAFREGRWREAAASVRLAIAFDPWNEAVKEAFAEVQHKAARSAPSSC